MKAHLMYKSKDFTVTKELPWGVFSLIDDLELNTLFQAMAQGDDFILNVVTNALMVNLTDKDEIIYRQDVLRDCLANQHIVKNLYSISIEAIELERRSYFSFFSHYPASILSGARDLMQLFISVLTKLRHVADESSELFKSDGFKTFFSMIRQELSDEYFLVLQYHLKQLKFGSGTLISANLGEGNKAETYVLRQPNKSDKNFLQRLLERKAPSYTFHIAERDEAGARALSEIEGRGIALAAKALAQSARHVLDFFRMVRTELGFYVGCLNLSAELTNRGQKTCFPQPSVMGERRLASIGLYDICLALRIDTPVIANDIAEHNASLIVITGANEGGKSTFLRSIGLAQTMMQAGMMVAADTFSADICTGVFTHYKREEDISMTSGKFDEELFRMNDIAAHLHENAIVLFNESFAATNEREGSEVARQIVQALLDRHVKVVFVTHMFELAHGLFESLKDRELFLRAERREGGNRTFRIGLGQPLKTSYGEDLYKKIFVEEETDLEAQAANSM